MGRQISGTMLCDLVRCERRFEFDTTGDPAARDRVSDFVTMLWEGGAAFEEEVVVRLQGAVVALRDVSAGERMAQTMASSIAWFDRWLRMRDPINRPRREAYNRDDVPVTVVLLERLIGLPVSEGPSWPTAA